MSSATSALVDRTDNCIVTSSANANLARSNIWKPSRNVPVLNSNKKKLDKNVGFSHHRNLDQLDFEFMLT